MDARDSDLGSREALKNEDKLIWYPAEVNTSIPTAQEVAKKMCIGLNLGNTMEAYNATNCEQITYEWIPVVGNNTPEDYETCRGAVETTQEVIDGIKAEGFDTVRMTLPPSAAEKCPIPPKTPQSSVFAKVCGTFYFYFVSVLFASS